MRIVARGRTEDDRRRERGERNMPDHARRSGTAGGLGSFPREGASDDGGKRLPTRRGVAMAKQFDLVVRGGTIADGRGGEPYPATLP